MKYKYDLSVITATYNEKENISDLISAVNQEFVKHKIKGEIIVVDDSSPDGTGEIVLSLIKKYKNLHLLKRPPKSGIGSAYGDGIKNSNGRVVITMDADFSHPPNVLEKLFSLANREVIVSGSRFLKSKSFDTKFYRKMGTGLLNIWLKLLFRLPIKDHTNGYMAIERDKLDKVILASSNMGLLPFDKVLYGIPIFVIGNKMGYKLGQVDAPYTFRKFGETKINFLRGLKLVFGDMLYSAGLFIKLVMNSGKIKNVK